MENCNNDWIKQIFEIAKTDENYQECVRMVAQLEPDFLQIRQKLSPQEQEILDSYIAACEELHFSLIYPAHRCACRDRPTDGPP